MEHGVEWVGESWDELKFIRQAVTFLVIGNKPKKTLEDITRDLCPVLSIQQLYRISTMYWDDKYNTETVSSEVGCQAGWSPLSRRLLPVCGQPLGDVRWHVCFCTVGPYWRNCKDSSDSWLHPSGLTTAMLYLRCGRCG